MNPIYHESNNMMLGGGNLKNVQDVSATVIHNEDGTFNSIATFWKPSAKELELLNANGYMTLYVMSGKHPPVWLQVNT